MLKVADIFSGSFAAKARNTFLYFGATMIGFLISIGTYPVFAEYLGVEEFAAINYFTNYSGFFGFFFSLNLYMYYSAVYFKLSGPEAENTLKAYLLMLLVWNAIAIFCIYLLSFWILDSVLNIKFEIRPYLLSSLTAISAVSIRSIFLIKLRLQKKALQFFVVSVAGKAGVILISLGFVIYYKATAEGRLLGAVIAELLCTSGVYWYVFRKGGFTWPLIELRKILTFIWPLLLASIVYYPIMAMDQMVLERYATKTELGLYSIGLGFAGYLHTFNFSVYQTIEPDIIRFRSQGDRASLKRQVWYLMLIASLTTLCFCLISEYLIDFMSHGKFTGAYRIANILSLSFFFVLLFSVGSTLLTTSGKSKSAFLVNLVGLAAIFIFTMLLKDFNSEGVAVARVLTYAVLSAAAYLLLKKTPQSAADQATA